jgi:hypothetical protein
MKVQLPGRNLSAPGWPQKWPGQGPAIPNLGSADPPYRAASAFAAWMSASLRNDITVTLRVR